MTSASIDVEFLEAAIGPHNTDYYLQRFRRFEQGRGAISWNWPAFFVTFFWLLYRKLWAYAIAWFFLSIISLALIVNLGNVLGGIGVLVTLGLIWIAPGLFANALYFHDVRKRVARAEAYDADRERRLRSLAAAGGTSLVAMIVPLAVMVGIVPIIGILAAIAIPAYQDYTIRAQVMDGLNLASAAKTAVVETYYAAASFPDSNAAAGIPAEGQYAGSYTSGIAILAGGQIRITYGNAAHAAIASDTLFLTPYVSNSGNIAWQCGNWAIRQTDLTRSAGARVPAGGGTLEANYRPANCRA